MALHDDLLTQAHHLAVKEPTRPRQASLRRSISTAYYALFHFLVARACRLVVAGAAPGRRALRHVLARCFEHAQVRRTSLAFSAPGGQSSWRAPAGPLPPPLVHVARAVVQLQDERHAADHDTGRIFRREAALAAVSQAREAIDHWERVKGTLGADAYLLGLLARSRG